MNLIVAVDQNWAIGKDGDQLVYLKEDLKRFRTLTSGHTVILGRKTLATFPGGRPLKNRRNLILSRNPQFQAEGAEVFSSVEELVKQADGDAFVIGGASVYEQLLPYCDTAYITKIHAGFPADTYFTNLDQSGEWEVSEESESLEQDGISYHYVTYSRIQ
ncbi:MAG: dihydrofolate reductase [Oscillospiraceae bacterium]